MTNSEHLTRRELRAIARGERAWGEHQDILRAAALNQSSGLT
jgi:hypothetical protein